MKQPEVVEDSDQPELKMSGVDATVWIHAVFWLCLNGFLLTLNFLIYNWNLK